MTAQGFKHDILYPLQNITIHFIAKNKQLTITINLMRMHGMHLGGLLYGKQLETLSSIL